MGIYLQAVEPTRLPPFRWDNVIAGNAIAVALTGMLIVFTALALISLFIATLPKILNAIEPYLPAVEDHHHAPTAAANLPHDEEKIVAAIGHVLHTKMQHMLKR